MIEQLDPRTNALRQAPWLRLLDRALGPARKVPTMLTPQEQKLYFWLAAQWADGAGAIVDLGCFAGGSTARLAEGARIAGLAVTVHGFDRFAAREAAKEGLLYRDGVEPFDGEDILPLARGLLAPWGTAVCLHRGEIDAMDWQGGPIEILVMDASKTARTMDEMSATFLPHLIPGKSLLVQQDLLHWRQPWVPAQMEMLAPFFQPVAHVERDTVVYLCTRAPDAAALRGARTAEFDDARLLDLIKAAQARFASTGMGLTERFEQMVLGLLANPGQRAAFRFKAP